MLLRCHCTADLRAQELYGLPYTVLSKIRMVPTPRQHRPCDAGHALVALFAVVYPATNINLLDCEKGHLRKQSRKAAISLPCSILLRNEEQNTFRIDLLPHSCYRQPCRLGQEGCPASNIILTVDRNACQGSAPDICPHHPRCATPLGRCSGGPHHVHFHNVSGRFHKDTHTNGAGQPFSSGRNL